MSFDFDPSAELLLLAGVPLLLVALGLAGAITIDIYSGRIGPAMGSFFGGTAIALVWLLIVGGAAGDPKIELREKVSQTYGLELTNASLEELIEVRKNSERTIDLTVETDGGLKPLEVFVSRDDATWTFYTVNDETGEYETINASSENSWESFFTERE